MIWANIGSIIDYWAILYSKADEKKRSVLEARIALVIDTQRVRMDQDYNILGSAGDHYQEITREGYYCSCTAFGTSAPTGEQKKPCKHLYALASGIIKNY
jgi:predicted nucleic acid-binding Zn finger protein